MTTTDKYQIHPDYYDNLEDCKKASKESHKYQPTNPRYKEFNQLHFTAGDEDQFQEYRLKKTNKDTEYKEVDVSKNLFVNKISPFWIKNQDIHALAVDNTFNYIFNKFKKGIFVKIQNNQLKVFLPFSKKNFINEWGNLVAINPKFGSLEDFALYINKQHGKNFKPIVNRFSNNWFANNALIRYEYPINEGDNNVANMRDMLLTLCKEKTLPDIEFFVNRRDFPIITNNGTEAYTEIFGDNVKLVSHNYDKYSPILSMVTSDTNSDIPIPTGDDWSRVSSYENKFFIDDCRLCPKPDEFNIPWENKKSTGVFRGSSTGVGVTIETNPRIKLAYMSSQNKSDTSGNFKDVPYLDAGISKWQTRARKLKSSRYLQTIDIQDMERKGIKLASFMTVYQQSEYKYIVHVDGHVSAFRLSLEMSMGCCLLIVSSKYRLWFRHLLVPYEHYVPVKEDLSDLIEKIKWCRENDKKCETIALNARKFYDTYLVKNAMLDYLQTLLVNLKSKMGHYIYPEKSPLELLIETEQLSLHTILLSGKKDLNEQIVTINKNKKDKQLDLPRCSGLLKAYERILKESHLTDGGELLFESKTSSVKKYQLPFVIKSSSEPLKINQQIHETYLGINAINKLSLELPHFQYTYGITKEKSTVIEYIEGKPFLEWIKKNFNMKDFLLILIQLAYALEIAQKRVGFVHNDLAPWNIMIQTYDKPKKIEYLLSFNKIVRIETNIVPVIIDYGKSHIITADLEHCGYINMFKMSTIEDIITILLTSLTEIPFNQSIVNEILILANFLSGNKYRKEKFNKMTDVNYFFSINKRYAERIVANKYELENKTPLDFVGYILENYKYKFPILQQHTKYLMSFDQNVGQSNFIYSLLLGLKVPNIFKDFLKQELPETTDLVYGIYMVYKFEMHLNFAIEFIPDKNEVDELYTECIEKIKTKFNLDEMTFNNENNQKLIELYKKFKKVIVPEKYTENTFLLPNKIEELKNSPENKSILSTITEDIIDTIRYKEIAEKVFSIYNYLNLIPENISEFLSVNETNIITQYTHINTLIKTSEKINEN
jgi:hypothetical protein